MDKSGYTDMRNSRHKCPSGLTLLSQSSYQRRVRDRISSSFTNCPSTSFSAHGLSYRHVYGRIIAYQTVTLLLLPNLITIRFLFDEAYVYGVSLTHGRNPRNHIWIFAGAIDETTGDPNFKCPCIYLRHQYTFQAT